MHSPFLQDSVDVAVIGAGFSGTMVAVHLLRQKDLHLKIALVERTSEFAKGLAYKTRDLTHRLNVPAAKMGAFPDDVEGFYRWLRNRSKLHQAAGIETLHPNSFVPRLLFGEFILIIRPPQSPNSVESFGGMLRRQARKVRTGAP